MTSTHKSTTTTSLPPNSPQLVPIIIGSDKDLPHARSIAKRLKLLRICSEIRVSSAHKATRDTLEMVRKYLSMRTVPTIITCAGKSNALSAVVDSKSFKPVIACPPLKHETMYDIYSTVSMPSDVCPMLVLKAENAALAAAKICAVTNSTVARAISALQQKNRDKLYFADLESKYACREFSLDNSTITHDSTPSPPPVSVTRTSAAPDGETFTFCRSGKVRDIYSCENNLILAATDRLSSFDRILTTVPYKGEILNRISEWWFDKTKHIVPNHLYSNRASPDHAKVNGRYMRVKCMKSIPIEFVMRSYLTGSTATSIWKNYDAGSRLYCGHTLPDGLVRNQPLNQPLLTPTTKAEHDELISKQEILDRGIMDEQTWNTCAKYAHALFEFGRKEADKRGLILVDTKYEFGVDTDGTVCLIDELHTPDSSRYWVKHSYQERFEKRLEPEIIDKDIIRKWVKRNYENPYDLDTCIHVTDEMRLETLRKYLQLYEIITGEEYST